VNAELRAPGDRYRVVIDVTSSTDGGPTVRRTVDQGIQFWDVAGPPAQMESGEVRPSSYMVVVDDMASLVLIPGENGLTVRWVRLLNASQAAIRARVIAGTGAPDWLPPESDYLIFDGDRTTAAAFKEQFIPLDGMAMERTWQEGETPLDSLVTAVGKSVARANAALARIQSEGGTSLVASVTMKICVSQVDLGQGRVLVALARPGQGQTCDQFIQLTMTTVPGACPPEMTTAAVTGAAGAPMAVPSPATGPTFPTAPAMGLPEPQGTQPGAMPSAKVRQAAQNIMFPTSPGRPGATSPGT
jgi:hypothetical protein